MSAHLGKVFTGSNPMLPKPGSGLITMTHLESVHQDVQAIYLFLVKERIVPEKF